MSNKTTINCPHCQTQIDVHKIQSHELEERLRQEHEAEREEARQKYKLHLDNVKAREKALREAQEKFEERLEEQLKLEKQKITNELKKALTLEKEQIAKAIEEQNELKLKQKDEQIEQMRRDIESAQRKAEQGSMQTQGEALELAIEQWLSSQFSFDTIEEVKKGAFGADCIQTIHTREVQNCGVICYESKNTKAWSDAWITKLKQDMIASKADMGVLVTSVYPKEMKRMGFVEGIWVCSLNEFKGSSSLLRESLIRIHQTGQKEENRSDKMSLLYTYMTGNEFQMQMTTIVEGFMTMQQELDKEKRSLMASWKRRQKTIDRILLNTTEMYGALQGIAGSSAIGHIDALELLDEDEL